MFTIAIAKAITILWLVQYLPTKFLYRHILGKPFLSDLLFGLVIPLPLLLTATATGVGAAILTGMFCACGIKVGRLWFGYDMKVEGQWTHVDGPLKGKFNKFWYGE